MNIQEIRKIAKNHGIKTSRASKLNIVREIQRQEGNFDCFATAVDGECNQVKCKWRDDCFSQAKKTLAH
ncbi:MAG: SAP domain-containing protein [Gammaproteobacteria bacterium]|nr:SAP domain-containing protein [Gammaproteobacteria bacterium]